jgi:hypothetical protein
MCKAIQTSQALICVSLLLFRFDEEVAWKAFLDMLQTKRLEELSCCRCTFQDESWVQNMFEALTTTHSIQTICLRDLDLQPQRTFEAFLNMMCACPLEKITVTACGLQSQHKLLICQTVRHVLFLNELDLSENSHWDEHFAETCLDAIGPHRWLERIRFSHATRIEIACARRIARNINPHANALVVLTTHPNTTVDMLRQVATFLPSPIKQFQDILHKLGVYPSNRRL